MAKYNPNVVEKKWQEFWAKNKTFEAKESNKKKYYVLEMLPYPSGNLHMGHIRNYTIGDVIARYKRMCGFDVLHPMGWDAFGLPAENAAREKNTHPAKWTYSNIENMKQELKQMGFSYDWDREVTTCKPEYYKWEQWLFIQMFKKNMAYKKLSYVNWCEDCQTVLAAEQVEKGCCWRCNSKVKQKELSQWFFKITDYADDLLLHCDKLEGWPQEVLTMQKNWIGKSIGASIKFQIQDREEEIEVFTTRPDTIFGATFMCIAPEHHLTSVLSKNNDNVKKFVEKIIEQSRASRDVEQLEKEGMFLDAYCINPITKKKLPIYVANFVLMEYGTGALMGVPAHDQRDFDFAQKYNIEKIAVISPDGKEVDADTLEEAYSDDGILINSQNFNGLQNREAIEKICDYFEKEKIGKKTFNFKLKDWGISRQRYWGTPIPIIYCDKCGIVPEDEKNLPVVLPEDAVLSETNPLLDIDYFKKAKCPKCGNENAKRETDTMDTFVESSWYFLRYCSPNYNEGMLNSDEVNHWAPIDQYIGGVEHAVMHLLYARYFTRVLKDMGFVNFKEPFTNLLTQGMITKETFECPNCRYLFPEEVVKKGDKYICQKCGIEVVVGKKTKMSKSKKNVVSPKELTKQYGADTIRLFCLFASPPHKTLIWNEDGIEGQSRFINRVWNLIEKYRDDIDSEEVYKGDSDKLNSWSLELYQKINLTIKKVTSDIEKFSFNTAISSIMELVNFIYLIPDGEKETQETQVIKLAIETIVLLLSPIIPHFAEESWKLLGKESVTTDEKWPTFFKDAIKTDEHTLVIQVNGKVRAKLTIDSNLNEETIKELALNNVNVQKFIEGKEIKKTILVQKKLINIVI